jgi:hypothetical protein
VGKLEAIHAGGCLALATTNTCSYSSPLHSTAVTHCAMNRLFGAKSTAPKPTLNSAISNVRALQPAHRTS